MKIKYTTPLCSSKLEINEWIYTYESWNWMKEYTFMFMNAHKKHTIYGKGDGDQRGQ